MKDALSCINSKLCHISKPFCVLIIDMKITLYNIFHFLADSTLFELYSLVRFWYTIKLSTFIILCTNFPKIVMFIFFVRRECVCIHNNFYCYGRLFLSICEVLCIFISPHYRLLIIIAALTTVAVYIYLLRHQ